MKTNFPIELTDIEKSIETNFVPVENNRSSTEELKRIKKYSDENLKLIESKLNTKNNEEKRSIIINLIAALDYYIHEIIIWGIIQITLNKFPEGKKYREIEVSIKYLKDIKDTDIFDEPKIKEEIIKKIRYETYQKWDSIKHGLSLILPQNVNVKIGNLTSGKNSPAKFQTDELEKINEKRNLIVHHFDREYNNASLRNNFDIDCQKSFSLISLIIDSIHEIITSYDNTQPETN